MVTSESPVRILKRDAPFENGPILTLTNPASTTHGSGPILTKEEKEKRAKEEQWILEHMRALTRDNPGLGFQDMFWDGPTTSRPPNKTVGLHQNSASDLTKKKKIVPVMPCSLMDRGDCSLTHILIKLGCHNPNLLPITNEYFLLELRKKRICHHDEGPYQRI